jgi:uncharacterized membrane protein SirB2
MANHKAISFIKGIVHALALIMLLSGNAFATQQHSDPEGLYSHLIAHIFFITAMIVLGIQIFKSRVRQRGWRCIGIAAVLFLLWNVDTFTVHIITESLPREIFTRSGGLWSTAVDLSSTKAKLFYIGKIFDHVFLVSSVFVFLKGILALNREIITEERQ